MIGDSKTVMWASGETLSQRKEQKEAGAGDRLDPWAWGSRKWSDLGHCGQKGKLHSSTSEQMSACVIFL